MNIITYLEKETRHKGEKSYNNNKKKRKKDGSRRKEGRKGRREKRTYIIIHITNKEREREREGEKERKKERKKELCDIRKRLLQLKQYETKTDRQTDKQTNKRTSQDKQKVERTHAGREGGASRRRTPGQTSPTKGRRGEYSCRSVPSSLSASTGRLADWPTDGLSFRRSPWRPEPPLARQRARWG